MGMGSLDEYVCCWPDDADVDAATDADATTDDEDDSARSAPVISSTHAGMVRILFTLLVGGVGRLGG